IYRGYVFTADEPRLVTSEARLSDLEKSNIELFRTAAPSVASITTEQLRFNPLVGVVGARGAGSGFVWDKAGHVVTNYHVIEGATTVYVQLHAGDPIRARVVGAAQEYDISVVKLSDPPANLTPIPVAASASPQRFCPSRERLPALVSRFPWIWSIASSRRSSRMVERRIPASASRLRTRESPPA